MTLTTSIAIGEPYNVREIFDFCRQLLGTPEGTPVNEGVCDDDFRPGCKEIYDPGGIGLAARLWIFYGADGPMTHKCDKWCATEVGPAKWDDSGQRMVTQKEIDEHNADVEGDPTKNGWATIEVTFDTSYVYRGDDGESCSDLHARLITALGQWLDSKGLPWKWQNEYSCEWFDRFDGLAEFATRTDHKPHGRP
jgi:hypothetical protein